ncbi:hypothetical protein MCOR29_003240 [Pyricularia oryzae]|nr:hypothetical protein MCOR29_003240 [Pyricularia oryzae]KAI6458518.1 hypothetical protein MCOR15_006334 [Pyricularia oryzae]KAI6520474.1 hypothetical protein MCOR16_008233 [Pyricularia oryzae]
MAGLMTTQRGLLLSLLVLGLAVYYRQRWQTAEFTASSGGAETKTYCYSGGVRTGLEHPARAECFSVGDGRVTELYADAAGVPGAEMRPGHAMPGLWDGHGHLLQYGEFLHSVDLFGAASVDEVNRRIVNYLEANPGVGSRDLWIRGVGWDQMALGGMPSADMLAREERLKGLYIMVDRVDVHCTWVSQSVLDLMPADLPHEVPGGEIIRDPGMGVFCDNAMDIVTALWPHPDRRTKQEFVRSAMKALHKVGLVGMHDAGATPTDLAMMQAMAAAGSDGGFTLRVYAMLECEERNTVCLAKAAAVRQEDDDMLTIRSVKLFGDGALGSWGSAMLEPYSDRLDDGASGSLLVNASTLTRVAREWAAGGWQVNIHAIGDLANRVAIDAMETVLRDGLGDAGADADTDALRRLQEERHRMRIEHAQIVHPDDQKRMFALGILPSIQPTHATSDMSYAELRLGPERTRTEAYRMKTFLPLNPVLGSDFPVEPPNPFQGIYAAVARKNPHTGKGADGITDHGWHLEEALTIEEALAGFTKGPAYGAFMEGKAGVIQKGSFADWVVIDQPLESLEPVVNLEDRLRNFAVEETWVAGRMVYSKQEASTGTFVGVK